MLCILKDRETRETIWVMGIKDIQYLYANMIQDPHPCGREYTVVKTDKIAQFMSMHNIVGPEIDMFMHCPNPDLHVHYDRHNGDGRFVVTMKILPRVEIERIINEETRPFGASITVAYMEMIYMDNDGEIRDICVSPINMTCQEPNCIYVGAVGFPGDDTINKMCNEYMFSQGIIDIGDTKYTRQLLKASVWKDIMNQGLMIWSGVQYALAHPVIQYCTQRDSVSFERSRNNKDEEKFKTVGMKKIYINGGMLAMNMRSPHSSEGSWFVHGHWRTLSSGKKIWIDGYWKGPDRDNPDTAKVTKVKIANSD